jgi:hypothetical protein
VLCVPPGECHSRTSTVILGRFAFKGVSFLYEPFVSIVRKSNRQGLDAWGRFAGHRDRVLRILTTVAGNGSSLGVLGAGNLNDLDLDCLLHLYERVDLADLDVDAVHAGLARQGATTTTVRVQGPVDLSGILDRLPAGNHAGDDGAALCGVLAHHRCVVKGAPFDVTLSAGLLTQLLQAVVDSSLSSGEVVAVSLALRDKHLADLVYLTRPGGTLVLVTDVVSTTTAPRLLANAEADLEEQMAGLVAARNFFTGTNPYRIAAVLEEDERFRGLVTDIRLVDPWLWQVTADRQHLTCAILARRQRPNQRDRSNSRSNKGSGSR